MTAELLHRYPDIVALDQLADQLRRTKDGAQRDITIKRIYRVMEPMIDELKRLETKLDVGMTWLGEFEGHPDHGKREEMWMQWEERYRVLFDALEGARKTIDRRPI
jgi:hypothetical protein